MDNNIQAKGSRKIIIFYSSIGKGHISAAQAIQQEIIRLDPAASVILQDIRKFMNPIWRKIDERLYWFIANNFTESFDVQFRSIQTRGNSVQSLSVLPNYPEEKILTYIESQAPDAILATHYGAAQVLGALRERGLLSDIKIGWLHTDFFEGYLPRISKRIDRTFLAHHELEVRWLAAGVPRDKIATTGMPVHIPTNGHNGRQDTLKKHALNPEIPTILVTGGKEGVGDYCTVVKSISRHYQCRVQIVSVCGTNTRLRAKLTTLSKGLPPHVTLRAMGLLPHRDMVSLMCAVDLLITKAGGMTPAEAFAIGLPTILLDVVSGHERENSEIFVRLGLAKRASDKTEAGKMAIELLADKQQLEAMLVAQRNFSKYIKISDIAQYVLNGSPCQSYLSSDFGAENGTPVTNINEVLTQLDTEAPADIELLLSYSIAKEPRRIVLENPFGHLAIRLGTTVYSANYVADRKTNHNFLQHMGLADYLYGVQSPSPIQIHTDTFGMAYGRETIGLRISGISDKCAKAMVSEANLIEEQFQGGTLHWDKYKCNCADVVVRILRAGNFNVSILLNRLGLPTMPLDVFTQAQEISKKTPPMRTNMVAYRQIPGARVHYRFSRFPLSLWQPLRSAMLILSDSRNDPVEMTVTKQVAAFGERRLIIDNLQIKNIRTKFGDLSHLNKEYAHLTAALIAVAADLQHLLLRQ